MSGIKRMTLPKNLPEYEYLNKRLFYEAETGKLFWRYCNFISKQWNSNWAWKEAGCIVKSGYRILSINDKLCFAHRIIWKLYYKVDPEKILDHVNNLRHDNRIFNLREATYSQNQQNRIVSNKYGKGVSFDSKRNKYQAYIRVNNTNIHLGRFAKLEDAQRIYRKTAIKNFGEFANFD